MRGAHAMRYVSSPLPFLLRAAGDHTRKVKITASAVGGIMKFAVKTLTCIGCKVVLGKNGAWSWASLISLAIAPAACRACFRGLAASDAASLFGCACVCAPAQRRPCAGTARRTSATSTWPRSCLFSALLCGDPYERALRAAVPLPVPPVSASVAGIPGALSQIAAVLTRSLSADVMCRWRRCGRTSRCTRGRGRSASAARARSTSTCSAAGQRSHLSAHPCCAVALVLVVLGCVASTEPLILHRLPPLLCSRDCPIFYRRKKVQKDLKEAQTALDSFSF